MANKKGVSSRGRLRVFFAEFEGEDETIQEGLKAIQVAVAKTFQPTIRTLPPPAPGTNGEQPSGNGKVDELTEDLLNGDDSIEPTQRTGSKLKQARKYPPMQLVKELDLRPEGKQSLREFYAEKSPKTQHEKIAVFVYYLCNVLGTSGVTANHVFTCFDDVGDRPPNDLPQILRNCSRRDGWTDTKDSSSIKITTKGVNMVKHDLPSKGE